MIAKKTITITIIIIIWWERETIGVSYGYAKTSHRGVWFGSILDQRSLILLHPKQLVCNVFIWLTFLWTKQRNIYKYKNINTQVKAIGIEFLIFIYNVYYEKSFKN